jgi:formylglycine-generating enzyme required for sulfatase activity
MNKIKLLFLIATTCIVYIFTGCDSNKSSVSNIPERFVNSIGMEMILVKTNHNKKINSFYISATEITNQQYEQFRSNHKMNRDSVSFKDNNPVIYVSYFDAQEFTSWLSKKEKKNYQIPTEKEWMYAATGGDKSLMYSTITGEINSNLANIYNTSKKDSFTSTSTVASFPSNIIGLYDMTGNVWEWCDTWYYQNRTLHRVWLKLKWNQNVTIPFIWFTKPKRWKILKGGSYLQEEPNNRITVRNAYEPDTKSASYGFRVIMRIK